MQLGEPAAWAYGLALLAWLVLAVRLVARARRERRGWPVASSVVLGALGAASGLLLATVPALQEGHLGWTVHRAFQAAQALCWLAILNELLSPIRGAAYLSRRVLARSAVVAVVLLAAFVPTPSPYAAHAATTPAGQGSVVAWIALAVLGLVLIEQVVRASSRDVRWSLKPLLVGLGACFVFDLFLFADAFLNGIVDRNLWAVRGLVGGIVVPLIAVGAQRSAGWRIDLSVSRSVIYHSTALLAAGVYLLVMAGTGYYVRLFGGNWGQVLQLALVVIGTLGIVLLVVSGSARARLRVLVAKNFFASRFDHRDEWMNVSRRLAHSPPGELPRAVVQLLADLVESPGGALWLRRAGDTFHQTARWSAPEVPGGEPATGPLPTFLETRGWVIDLDEFGRHPDRYPGLVIPSSIGAIPNAWLIVPLASARDLVGFVLLMQPRAPIEVDWEVRDLLKAASQHAASHLANLAAAERLLEAGKFEAFNRMSAFVVHDIKNLVAQLSLLSRNAERHLQNPEFQADLLGTVRHVTERMNHLLSQLRAGATPVANASRVDLRALVEQVVRDRDGLGPPVQLDLPDALVVLGHADRLARVVRNLVANAQDATRDGSPVLVTGCTTSDNAQLEIVDRGIGMSPEFIRDRLFRPFASTKASGMGIGAYESHQYVNEIGGRIDVESRPGEGTRIVVTLPVPPASARDEAPEESEQRAA